LRNQSSGANFGHRKFQKIPSFELRNVGGKTVTGGVVNAFRALNPTSVAPGTPVWLSVTIISAKVAQVSWTDTAYENGYEIQREKKSGAKWQPPVSVGQTGANVTVFLDSPGKGTFQYRVRAFNEVGSSEWTAWSNPVTF
jgi:thermitase